MSLERGSRRLFVVLSVAVLGSGIALDAGKLWSHAKIYVTNTSGLTAVFDTWNLVGSPPYEQDPATRDMVLDLMMPPMEKEAIADANPSEQPSVRAAMRRIELGLLKEFRVLRGPGAWSWEDVQFTPIATGIVVLLWAGFFCARWVARGFTSQPPA